MLLSGALRRAFRVAGALTAVLRNATYEVVSAERLNRRSLWNATFPHGFPHDRQIFWAVEPRRGTKGLQDVHDGRQIGR